MLWARGGGEGHGERKERDGEGDGEGDEERGTLRDARALGLRKGIGMRR